MQYLLWDINYVAIVIAAIVYYIFWALWYSPMMFWDLWMKISKTTMVDKKDANTAMVKMFITSLVSALILWIISSAQSTFWNIELVSLAIWLSIAVSNYTEVLFEKKALWLYWINVWFALIWYFLMWIVFYLI